MAGPVFGLPEVRSDWLMAGPVFGLPDVQPDWLMDGAMLGLPDVRPDWLTVEAVLGLPEVRPNWLMAGAVLGFGSWLRLCLGYLRCGLIGSGLGLCSPSSSSPGSCASFFCRILSMRRTKLESSLFKKLCN